MNKNQIRFEEASRRIYGYSAQKLQSGDYRDFFTSNQWKLWQKAPGGNGCNAFLR